MGKLRGNLLCMNLRQCAFLCWGKCAPQYTSEIFVASFPFHVTKNIEGFELTIIIDSTIYDIAMHKGWLNWCWLVSSNLCLFLFELKSVKPWVKTKTMHVWKSTVVLYNKNGLLSDCFQMGFLEKLKLVLARFWCV